MSPAPAPVPATINVRALCQAAARAGRDFTPDHARLGLGAISNMFCLHALDHDTKGTTAVLRGLASDRIADRRAALIEIQRAVPRANAKRAERILSCLVGALDDEFRTNGYDRAQLIGFGTLEPVNLDRSEYRLHIELPLTRHLRSTTSG